ncbi:nucleoporin-interacting protein [Chengkuizengella axinellae]|uniref:Nucleoporin-interacting protein n=1 Tax=Chengkuizengella axinellae TaxID=3064388 RepID=A0ABT9J141_9BACL|nr:nucleoporin-interacting protein [Chengkuizengella sp. 2205SS18-9]MDP5275341.1 nucleoporin-interacting protein [Chengkuizengella sp. 2205SS18-9]
MNPFNNYKIKWASSMIVIFIFVGMFSWRFMHISSFARSWDIVDFALALDRFDLLAMQPHFPGYPYFILGGTMINSWVSDPVQALVLFNVLMTMFSAVPIYMLVRKMLTRELSLVAVLFVLSFSYISVMSVEPMSEGAAIAVLWWYIWSINYSLHKKSTWISLLPLFLFSVLMGIRLSYLVFGVGIVLLWWLKLKRERPSLRRYGIQFFFLVLFQCIWVIGLVVSEGSLNGFIQLSLSFTAGHFSDWGGAYDVASDPIVSRIIQLLFYNLYWTGFSAQSVILAVITSVFLVLIIYKVFQVKRIKMNDFSMILAVMLICYFLWALFAQNLDKPRHISPLVGPIALLMIQYLLKSYKSKMLLMIVLISIAFQVVHGADLVKSYAEEKPAVYQLNDFLSLQERDFIVYTWEETRVFQYLKAPYAHQRVFTYDYFLQEIKRTPYKEVMMTEQVLRGFEQQVGDLSHRITPIKTFYSNPLFDPVYYEITLYKWK